MEIEAQTQTSNHSNKFIQETVFANNERYLVVDDFYPELGVTASKTVLHQKQSTRGHRHPDSDEVYLFASYAAFELEDNPPQEVHPGDMIYVRKNLFHRVVNLLDKDCTFFCVFKDSAQRPA